MKSERKQDLIFGKRPILEALNSSLNLKCIYALDSLEIDSALRRIFEEAKKRGISLKKLNKKEFGSSFKNENTQGIVAEVSHFNYSTLNEVIDSAKENQPSLVVVCDHITDVGNFGAIIRSAESAGALCVVIPNSRSVSVTSAVFKTSAGAISHLPIVQVSNVVRTLDKLKDLGFWVVGASEHADNLLWEADLIGNIAIVLGNEEKGISELVLKNCDDTFKLPQLGVISSLNVAQASTVFMYEWVRQNGKK